MTNIIELEKINNNQQVKLIIHCTDQEVKAYLASFINENKNLVKGLNIYPMASAGNKSATDVLNLVLEFGADIWDTVKDELVSIFIGYLLTELKNKKQQYVVKDKNKDNPKVPDEDS